MRHDRAELRGELRDASAQLQQATATARQVRAREEERAQGAIDRHTALERKVEQVWIAAAFAGNVGGLYTVDSEERRLYGHRPCLPVRFGHSSIASLTELANCA
jgi:hypothetical protein